MYPNQDLRVGLQNVAFDLNWSSIELVKIAARISLAGNEADAEILLKMCAVLHAGEDCLSGYVEAVNAGKIVWGKLSVQG